MVPPTSTAVLLVLLTLNGEIHGAFGSPLQDDTNTSTKAGDPNTLSVNDDGACVEPKAAKMDIVWAIGFSQRAKYTPMGSQLYYATTAKLLTGHPLAAWTELDQMCPEAKSTSFGGSTITGFGKELVMLCELEGIGVLKCCPKTDKDMDDCDNSKDTSKVVASWTDSKDYMVTISCQPDGHKVWNVVSTKKVVDADAKVAILEHVKQYGFDPKNAVEIKYDSC